MKLNALIVLATVLTGSSNDLQPTETAAEPGAYTYESAVRERFADPASVQFRDVENSTDGRSVCGEVNGRDRHGSLVGFQRFLVYGANGGFMVLLANDDGSQHVLKCN